MARTRLPSLSLNPDIAKAIAPDCKYEIVGIRPGEKLHEDMITENDAINTVEFDDYFVIMPNSEYLSWDKDSFLNQSNGSKGKQCKEGFSYNSGTNEHFLTVDELRLLLENYI